MVKPMLAPHPTFTGKQTIPITLAHIQAGWQHLTHCCPIALAIDEVYTCHDLHVTAGRILLLTTANTYLFQNAQSLQTWISTYDDTGQQQPTILILDFDTRTALVLEGSLQP